MGTSELDNNSGLPSLWTPVLNKKAPSGFSDLWFWTEKYTIGFPGSEAFGLGLSHAVSIPGFAACRSPVMGLLSLHNHDREHPGSKSGSRKASKAGHHNRRGVRCNGTGAVKPHSPGYWWYCQERKTFIFQNLNQPVSHLHPINHQERTSSLSQHQGQKSFT
ncbi:uncharacterized protein LOC129136995 isoform X2 [Pan troglodytes]|uniref:uncharacterized protein LOC129136995 isoform X2 n=1 Tax=Pan troglodytes TaxID=9598 RepID=UPI0030135D87